MSKNQNSRGFTLVELIITIAIGSIITIAATTVLLLGLRIYKQSTDTATRQNEVRVGMTVMEELIAEGPVTGVGEKKVYTEENAILLSYDAGSIFTGAGAQIMENVDSFDLAWKENLRLLTVTIVVDDEQYVSSIYCRATTTETEATEESAPQDGAVAYAAETGSALDLETLLRDGSLSPNVRAFLKTLTSQTGSTGRILTEDGEGEYYSEWYIGSYEDHPGWSAETPWCACFVSWALEECSGYLQGQVPRFANVDSFWAEYVTSDRWKTENPESGDIVFFDWIVDTERNPQHVGVVLAENDGWIYTIEGNSNGRVALCRYRSGDSYILGYGIPDWT